MKRILVLLLSVAFVLTSCMKELTVRLDSIVIEDAPFEMEPIIYPDFSESERFLITDFGAVEDDKEANYNAIAQAIDKATVKGGVVVIPKGEWLTKKIHLKSNVNLHLDEGAVLLFSEKPEDYLPAVHSTWEGYECYNYSPLIYAYECENVAITGKGELKSKLDIWRIWYRRPSGHMNSLKELYYMAAEGVPVEERNMVNDSANMRPHFIQFNRCENILMDGVKITNSPFWVIHPYLSKNVVIRNVKVYAHGHNNDGVDPEMSQNVLIENCEFDQGDDAIAIKAGSGWDAWRLNTPSRNIVIRGCYVKNGHQLLAVGSELSGGIENVWFNNCTVNKNAKMFNLAFIKTNERRGGFVRNIIMENIDAGRVDDGVLGIDTDVLYQWRNLVPTIDRKLTDISNIKLKNVTIGTVEYKSRLIGNEELPIKNIIMENVTVEDVRGDINHIHENVENFVEL